MNKKNLLGLALSLPNGSSIPNRIVKSALSETLGTVDHQVTPALPRLYRHWAEGEVGLCITGNVMVDSRHIGEPNNVVVEDERDLPLLKEWAQAAQSNGGKIWMQLNHPGKQAPKMINKQPMSPSAIPLANGLDSVFAKPREMTEEDILDVIARFGEAAAIAQKAGFDGVQIHAAHGYLVSQFLSPIHNKRQDKWGGSIENRMRFAINIYHAIRALTGPKFSIGIKLNSADFQRGGFDHEDAIIVAKALAEEGVDLIEISGGSYEAPAMTGATPEQTVKESTKLREAYFLDFAEKLREHVSVPLMVTGGFRTSEGMQQAIESNACDLVGLGRPLCIDPDIPKRIFRGEEIKSEVKLIKTGIKFVDDMAMMEVSWYELQLHRLAKGKQAQRHDQGFWSLLNVLFHTSYRSLFKGVGRLRA